MSRNPPPPAAHERLPNPNYPAVGPRSAFSTYPSAPQQPSYDPFARRDPFMPTAHVDKRDAQPSYRPHEPPPALSRPSEYSHKDVLQPVPPPPPSPFRSGPPPLFANEHSRRGSLGASYSHGPTETVPPPPPPSAFRARHMPPPSSSPESPSIQYTPNTFSRASASSLPASSFLNPSRNQQSPFSGSRPGTSMSISSIMTSEPIPALSASRPGIQGGVPESTQRSQTPDRYHGAFHQISNSSRASPDHNRQGMSRLLQPFSADSSIPPRPYSQPVALDTTRERVDIGHPDAAAQSRRSDETLGFGARRTVSDEQRASNGDKLSRDRALSDLAGSRHPSYDFTLARPTIHEITSVQQVRQPEPYQPRVSGPWSSSPDRVRPHELVYARAPSPKELSSVPNAQFAPSAQPYLPAYGPHATRPHYAEPARDLAAIPSTHESRMDGAGEPGPALQERIPRNHYEQPPMMLEEPHLQQKTLSFLQAEASRRMDRGSPLPQAVQGVSAQPTGSGRDPGVKSEFGRMFSGLGSGIGSTPQPLATSSTGAPTPLGQSPTKDEDVDGRNRGGRETGYRNGRTVSRAERRTKRAYDDEGQPGSESGDGKASPLGGRGNKKSKGNRPGPHHHHHPVGHHHHHHRKEDDPVSAPLVRRSSSNQFGSFKFNASTPNMAHSSLPSSTQPIHHHHHHHAPPHHHHHSHPPSAKPLPTPIRRPITTIKTNPLVESVANLPRRHIGSQIYAPTTTASPSSHPFHGNNFPFSSVPNNLPTFDADTDVNCTFTIRVPRTYLTDSARELICRERRVWGTDVYTDDSDPVAAAIHAGWIRGAWRDDIDVSLLDLIIVDPSIEAVHTNNANDTNNDTISQSNARDKNALQKVLTSPPENGPIAPQLDKDLQITLLVLPSLENYASSVWHGIKSRAWGGNHDGLSFKVEKIEWVNEGVGARFEERGRSAKKQRMKEQLEKDRRSRALASGVPAVAAAATRGLKGRSNIVKAGIVGRVAA